MAKSIYEMFPKHTSRKRVGRGVAAHVNLLSHPSSIDFFKELGPELLMHMEEITEVPGFRHHNKNYSFMALYSMDGQIGIFNCSWCCCDACGTGSNNILQCRTANELKDMTTIYYNNIVWFPNSESMLPHINEYIASKKFIDLVLEYIYPNPIDREYAIAMQKALTDQRAARQQARLTRATIDTRAVQTGGAIGTVIPTATWLQWDIDNV